MELRKCRNARFLDDKGRPPRKERDLFGLKPHEIILQAFLVFRDDFLSKGWTELSLMIPVLGLFGPCDPCFGPTVTLDIFFLGTLAGPVTWWSGCPVGCV